MQIQWPQAWDKGMFQVVVPLLPVKPAVMKNLYSVISSRINTFTAKIKISIPLSDY